MPERIAWYSWPDLTIRYCNRAKAAEYGLEPRELEGARLDEIVGEPEMAVVRRHLAQLSAAQPVRRLVVGDDGRRIEWVDQLLEGSDGQQILSVGRDVTEREATLARLGEAERRFDLAIDGSPIGIAVVGLDGRLLRVNQALCGFLDRSAEELLMLTTLDVTHPDDIADDLTYGQALVEGDVERGPIEKRYLRPDGSVVTGLLTLTMIETDDGRPLHLLGQVMDITDRVERESALRRHVVEEERTVSHLRELDAMKNTFLTAVSHELRTPLTAVEGFAKLLQRQHRELSDDRVDAVLERLVGNVERLGQLLADLLDLDRLTRGTPVQPRLDATQLSELVRDVIAAEDLGGRPITADTADVRIPVDRVKVQRIVHNLLANAARHTPDGTRIWVRVAWDGPAARISVEDAGPGVDDELKAVIFEPFTMGASDAAKVGGTGVGLAIVRGFTALHGGEAWVEDRPGGGAAFHVRLPDLTRVDGS
jgi:PAS domain S-box-containing protein